MSRSENTDGTGFLPPFMKTITDGELNALTTIQKGFIVCIRPISPELNGDEVKEYIATFYPPAMLLCQDLCDMPTIFVELRNYIDARGGNLVQHSSRRIINTLAHGIYTIPADRDDAIEIAKETIARIRRVRKETKDENLIHVTTHENSQPQQQGSRQSHNICMRLKDADDKYSGNVEQCWMDFVDEYKIISTDYDLNPRQQLQFLHNLLSKDAKRFYLEHIAPVATSFAQAVDMVGDEYNSPVRQTKTKNYLSSLKLETFVKDGMDTSTALIKVYEIISKKSRQAPAPYRDDHHMVDFLRNAVASYSWADHPISRIPTTTLYFQMFFGELESSLTRYEERASARKFLNLSASTKPHTGGSLDVYYAGQGRYAHHPKSVRPQHRSKGKPPYKQNSLEISGCFNCGNPNHMVRDFKQPRNLSRAAAKKLEYYQKKDAISKKNAVHLVLADVLHQLGDEDEDDPTDDVDNDDFEILQAALVSLDDEQSEIPSSGANDNLEPDTNEILIMSTTLDNPSSSEFHGACIDSGASKTVIGFPQAKAYCSLINTDIGEALHGKKLTFTFGAKKHIGLGYIKVRIPVSRSSFLTISADVVNIDVPLLLGLDVLTRTQIVLDFSDDTVKSKTDGWHMPLIRKNGHLYMEWPVNIYFTETELRKVHRHFHHPHLGKMFAVMKRANPDEVSSSLMSDLEKISATCDVCQRESNSPHRFRVSLLDLECIFNRTICFDLMSLDGATVLHIVDRDTKFNAACFLKGESTADVWDALMNIWVSRYVGFPERIAVDQGPQFKSMEWKRLLLKSGITHQPSGVESHNAIGVGKRYHAFLRRIYHKVRADSPHIATPLALQISIKAVNDTAGPSGLVPTLLVFGVLPRISIIPKDLQDHTARMKAMHNACNEMAKISHQHRLRTALRCNVPSAADMDYKIGDEVLMYREKPIGKWIGPFVISGKLDKMLTLDTGDRIIPASIDKVKLYQYHDLRDNNNDATPSHLQPSTDPDTHIAAPEDNLDYLLDVPSDEISPQSQDEQLDCTEGPTTPPDIVTPADDTFWDPETQHIGIHISSILMHGDPRADTSLFQRAKLKEIQGLKERKVWRVVPSSQVPQAANILGGRFVLSIKNIGTKDVMAKARYVAQGNRDKDKPYMVHDVTTLRSSSIRLILSVAATKLFRLFSHDVDQAYVQSKDKLSRQIFLRPKKKTSTSLELENTSFWNFFLLCMAFVMQETTGQLQFKTMSEKN